MRRKMIVNLSEPVEAGTEKKVRIEYDVTNLTIKGALDRANRVCNEHVTIGVTKLESIYFYEEGVPRHDAESDLLDVYQPLPRVGRETPPPKKP